MCLVAWIEEVGERIHRFPRLILSLGSNNMHVCLVINWICRNKFRDESLWLCNLTSRQDNTLLHHRYCVSVCSQESNHHNKTLRIIKAAPFRFHFTPLREGGHCAVLAHCTWRQTSMAVKVTSASLSLRISNVYFNISACLLLVFVCGIWWS